MCSVEEKVKIVAELVSKAGYESYVPKQYYPNMTEKTLKNIVKHIDPNINTTHVAAAIDTTIVRNMSNGTVFTINGVYDRDIFSKTFYMGYADISSYEVLPNKKGSTEGVDGNLKITLKNGAEYETHNYGKSFARALDMLIPAARAWHDDYSHKEAGVIAKYGLTEGQLAKCHAIIHVAAAGAGGVGTGLAQIPLADTAVITPIQVAMIMSLGPVFDIRISEGVAKGMIGSAAAAVVGRSVSQLLVGWIPVVGNAINTATAAGITELIGWLAVKHFSSMSEDDRAKARVEGMKAGYAAASDEYEMKLKKQADEFIKQKCYAQSQRDEYENLIDEYEKYIERLQKQREILGSSELLAIPESLNNSYNTMKDELDTLRQLKECS